jgi:two-component system, chemotaxis family, sensor kinase CheA
MSGANDDIVKEFLLESYENLDQLDRDFVALEKDPHSRELLGGVFRTIHTIKGTCGFLGFHRLEAVAHAGESVLSLLREGALSLDPQLTSELLAMVDAVRAILDRIESNGEEGNETYDAVIETLLRVQAAAPPRASQPLSLSDFAPARGATSNFAAPAAAADGAAEAANVPAAKDETPAPPPPDEVTPAPPSIARPATTQAGESPRISTSADARLFDHLIQSGRLDPDQLALAERQQLQGDPRRIGEILVDHGVLDSHEVLEALVAHHENQGATVVDGTVRVDVRVLDRLVTLVSELVLARNQILQYIASHDFSALPATSQRLNLITTELQEGIMKTRMQPIGNLWNKLPRLVRDVASACNKEVRLEVEGRETELDKTVLEAIRDPLMHLVRNAIDHGIEGREIRSACRKNIEGRVLLRAYHEGGLVYIEISDDGAGLPIERIRRKALERKLVTPERAAMFGDRDWANLIFMPGFSTSQSVTSISGRGVGMDVVKTNIERIGGTVDIQTQPTIGTTVYLKIPLTLAIVPALIVTDDGERFAIPQAVLQELLRIAPAQVPHTVEWVHEAPVMRLRDHLLPLVFLRELLHERQAFTATSLASRDGLALHVVVLNADSRTFGLVVDEVNIAEEIVVKPLVEPLKNVGVLAGATILGDGRVGLILDIPGVARAASVSTTAHRLITPALPGAGVTARRGQALLVVEVRKGWRVAVPLARVARIEEFWRENIEKSGPHDVVQYRGGIMPVLSLAKLLDPQGLEAAKSLRVPAVVFEHHDACIAVSVNSIIDVTEDDPALQPVHGRPGIAAAAVLQDRVVDMLDVDALLELAAPERAGLPAAARAERR